MTKQNQEPNVAKRRRLFVLLLAFVAAYYGVCGFVYFFHFRDEIRQWWDSRGRHRQLQRSSDELRHDKETISVDEFPR